MQLPPLSLYIHLPWCVNKCPYCDFNSHRAPETLPERDYIHALSDEFSGQQAAIQGRHIQSIFLGGGTPSLFSPDAIADILEMLRGRLQWAESIEITLEANPGTVDRQRFRGYREAGVNRLSIGVQSFDDRCLQRLGRIHNGAEAHRAITAASEAGFETINLDLMVGLPGQTDGQALQDLRAAIAHGVKHISWYELTIEPNTDFFSHPPTLPPEDDVAEMETAGSALLADSGYQRYEISAYCRPGSECTHNLNYWQFGDYLGLGAGAHSKISTPEQDKIYRRWNTRVPTDYIAAGSQTSAGCRELSPEQLPLEFMMNALRLSAGVDPGLFEARTGLPLGTIGPALEQLRRQGLLMEGERLCTTPEGNRFLDNVLQAF